MRRLWWLLVVVACKRGVAPPEKTRPPDPEAAQAFAEELATAMRSCDAEVLDRLIDFETIARAALAKADAPGGFERGFLESAQRGAGAAMCVPGADYRVLRVRDEGGEVVMRILDDATGLNYHVARLGVGRDGVVRARDLLGFGTGEWLSETYLAMIEGIVSEGSEERAKEAIETLQAVRDHLAAEDPAAARLAFDRLPPRVRATRSVQIDLVTIGALESDDAYRAALAEYQRNFPDDPALDLMVMDASLTFKEWTEALARVERLDERVGGDPYLDQMRAWALRGLGRPAEALTAARRAVNAEPERAEAWDELLAAQLASADHPGTLETIAEMTLRFDWGWDPAAIRDNPLWASFITSAEGASWLAGLPPS
jgi:hypothetical protein